MWVVLRCADTLTSIWLCPVVSAPPLRWLCPALLPWAYLLGGQLHSAVHAGCSPGGHDNHRQAALRCALCLPLQGGSALPGPRGEHKGSASCTAWPGTWHRRCRPCPSIALTHLAPLLQITSVLNDTVDAYLGGKTGTLHGRRAIPRRALRCCMKRSAWQLIGVCL